MDIFLSWTSPIFSIIAVAILLVLLLKSSTKDTGKLEQRIREEFRSGRDEAALGARGLREEVTASLNASAQSVGHRIGELGKLQKDSLESFEKRVTELTASNEEKFEKVRATLDAQIKSLQESNEKKLDQMRQTVDEKLQSTLEKRLGESFKVVSDQLQAVQQGLGEMKNLASDVGDLQRVLTNVKVRGTWGEVQLGAILEEILTPDQFEKNVQPKNDSRETVEFAVRLPGSGSGKTSNIWLPIDSKFPQEDYQRLVSASESADSKGVEQALCALIRSIKSSAKDISKKYISPPETTDFAIMFLPTEGLYAEVLRRPGLVEEMQRTYRVVITGPTTLSATLNSLRMGFRTLAIEKRSSEVWTILEAVKTEFGKFGTVLDKVRKQLNTASMTIEDTSRRTRAIARTLRDVEQMPTEDSAKTLGIEDQSLLEIDPNQSDKEI